MYYRIKKVHIKNYIINWKRINLNIVETYKPFFILNNLIKINGKFRWIFRDIISEPIFLIFSFLTLKNNKNNFELSYLNIKLNNINVKWFLNFSKKLKYKYYKWKKNINILKNINLDIWIQNSCINLLDVIGQAVFIVVNEIYKNKTKDFIKNFYGFDSKKSINFLFKKIKTKWLFINGFILFEIKKSFNFINRNILFNQLKKKIQDQNLIMLISQFFRYKVLIKNKILNVFEKKYIIVKCDHIYLFFFNIYLTCLDHFLDVTILKQDKSLIKNNIIKSKNSKEKISIQFLKNKQQYKKFLNLENLSLINIKYVRYVNNLLIGLLAKKKLIFKLKIQLSIWIKSQLHLEFIKEKINFVKISENLFKFLSFKINYNYNIIKYPKISEKQLKIKKKLSKTTIVKNITDLIWHNYRKKPFKLLLLLKNIYQFRNKNFEFEFINLLKTKRKRGIQYFALKLIEVQKKIFNFNITNNLLFKKLKEIEKILFILKNVKKKVQKKMKETFFFNKYILNQIIKKFGIVLNILYYDLDYIYEKVCYSKFKIKWPIKITKPLNVPDKILFNANKYNHIEKKLAIIINYLQKIQFKIINNNNSFIFLNKISSQKIKQQFLNLTKNIKNFYTKNKFIIIQADINNIYLKLKKTGILKFNKIKVLSYSNFKIIFYFKNITIELLYFYQYCDNFYLVKTIINYYIRRSLFSTLKQKVINFKNLLVNNNYLLYTKNIITIFFSFYEINFWKISHYKNINIIIITQKFKNLQKIYLKYKN